MRNGALLVVIAGSVVVNGLLPDPVPAWRQLLFVLLALAAYLHGRHLPVRHGWAILAATAVPPAAYAVPAPEPAFSALVFLGILVALPWLAGRFQRQQADLVRAGAERVAQLERERAFAAEHVRLRERARIAADLHDFLGHELALIALRAGALELSPGLTAPGRDAAAELRASAVTATDRLRHTVGLIRAGGTAPTRVPGESLDALVDRARDAGMTVRLHRAGPPPAGGGTAGSPADLAVHRVVQEALTNAARHASGAAVDVTVEHSGGATTVTVRNPAARTDLPPASGAGTGLDGLREHVRLVGGTLRAGADGGFFTVTASVPAA